jgi:hypothetical protein
MERRAQYVIKCSNVRDKNNLRYELHKHRKKRTLIGLACLSGVYTVYRMLDPEIYQGAI